MMKTETTPITAMPAELQPSIYLGPAEVVEVDRTRVRIAFPDQKAWAEPALGYPYAFEPADKVLVISQDERWYIIGVLEGTGKTTFTAPGDLNFKAPRGAIHLASREGVTVRSPVVRLHAGKLEIVARTVHERFEEATRWVKQLFRLRAGRTDTRVEGTCRTRATRIIERAKDDVSIDGRKIRLG